MQSISTGTESLSAEQLLDEYSRGGPIMYCLAAAVELQLDRAIPQEGASCDAIAETLDLKDAETLYDTMSVLARLGIFRQKDSVFFNTSASLLFPQYREIIAFRASQANMGPWPYLSYQIKEGRSANMSAFTMPFFEWLQQNPKQRSLFHEGMLCQTRNETLEILQAIGDELQSYKNVVDVGCGIGHLGQTLAQIYRNLSVTLYDRPEVIQQARTQYNNGPNPSKHVFKVFFKEGNFFTHVPSGDCFILKRVAFNHPNDAYAQLLQNIVHAMNTPQGGLFVIEPLRPEPTDPSTYKNIQGSLLAVTMRLQDGVSRTVTEHEQQFVRVGLRLERTFETPSLTILKAVLA